MRTQLLQQNSQLQSLLIQPSGKIIAAEHDPPLRVSFGVSALCEDEPASAEYLLAAADRALYGAKAEGGDRVALSAGSS